jgi:hypothetical protein
MSDLLEERLHDHMRDLQLDAGSWRESADMTGGHAAATLTRDALENEKLAAEFGEIADEVEALRTRLKDAEQQLEVLRPGGTYAWKSKCERLRTALVTLVGVDGRAELEQMELFLRSAPMPAEDKAATIDAVNALLATLPKD